MDERAARVEGGGELQTLLRIAWDLDDRRVTMKEQTARWLESEPQPLCVEGDDASKVVRKLCSCVVQSLDVSRRAAQQGGAGAEDPLLMCFYKLVGGAGLACREHEQGTDSFRNCCENVRSPARSLTAL